MSIVESEAGAEAARIAGTIKNVALLLVAPFIGLTYAILMPFVAIGVLVWLVGKELAQIRFARLAAAPFVGLAMLALLPFAGIAMLAWVGIGGEMPQALVVGQAL
jgi:hypothetical protein